MQLLTPQHAHCEGSSGTDHQNQGALIRLLGGTSGRDVDKRLECEKLGHAWKKLDVDGVDSDPNCLYYLQLELEGHLIDCGSHEVALCRVVSMVSDDSINDAAKDLDYVSTRKLCEMGTISEFGIIVHIEE